MKAFEQKFQCKEVAMKEKKIIKKRYSPQKKHKLLRRSKRNPRNA
jgi:hypothetical protein